jgi:RNA polymerase sigma-70 factor (ECF subfamily)
MKGVSISAVAWKEISVSEPVAREEQARRAEEAEWIARTKAGDLDTFELIYARYEAAVFRHAYRLLENRDEADDVRQETFVRACQSLNRFRGDARLKTYLLAICGNICRDRLRHHRRHPEKRYGLRIPEEANSLTDASSATHEDPFMGLQRVEDAARVRVALRQLAPHDREIMVLRYVEGLEIEEIAAVTGLTRVGVPVRLFRARRRLKDIFLSLLKEEGE